VSIKLTPLPGLLPLNTDPAGRSPFEIMMSLSFTPDMILFSVFDDVRHHFDNMATPAAAGATAASAAAAAAAADA